MQTSDLHHKGYMVWFQAEGHRKSGERFGNPFQIPHHIINLSQTKVCQNVVKYKTKQQQSVAQHSFYMAYQFLNRSGKELKIM